MGDNRFHSWTDERVTTLKTLYREGFSCSQIAEKLGGVSRNAVIGKLTRLGLSAKGGVGFKKAADPRNVDRPVKLKLKAPVVPRNTRAAAGANLRLDARAAAADPNRADPINGLNFQSGPGRTAEPRRRPDVAATGVPARIIDPGFGGCRWPINDPGRGRMDEALFCCGLKAPGETRYCSAHLNVARAAVQPAKPKNPPPLGGGRGFRFGPGRKFAA